MALREPSMKTPLGRILGLGSARDGTMQFWRQRLTSLAILPLSLFAVVVVVALAGKDQATVAAALGNPWISVPLLALLALTAWHMKIGMQEVIDDYIHAPALKLLATLGNIGFSVAVAGVAIFTLLRLSFGG